MSQIEAFTSYLRTNWSSHEDDTLLSFIGRKVGLAAITMGTLKTITDLFLVTVTMIVTTNFTFTAEAYTHFAGLFVVFVFGFLVVKIFESSAPIQSESEWIVKIWDKWEESITNKFDNLHSTYQYTRDNRSSTKTLNISVTETSREVFFETLHIPENSSTDEIKKAYRAFMKVNHPDKNHDPLIADKVQTVMSYYEQEFKFI